jgi:hypothetical protein
VVPGLSNDASVGDLDVGVHLPEGLSISSEGGLERT